MGNNAAQNRAYQMTFKPYKPDLQAKDLQRFGIVARKHWLTRRQRYEVDPVTMAAALDRAAVRGGIACLVYLRGEMAKRKAVVASPKDMSALDDGLRLAWNQTETLATMAICKPRPPRRKVFVWKLRKFFVNLREQMKG